MNGHAKILLFIVFIIDSHYYRMYVLYIYIIQWLFNCIVIAE